jgi:nucleotide-binding universal stress UspA family protein
MKTILVPTDFSPAAYTAARYAIHLAKKFNAGIELCTAIKVPAESVMAAQVAWPLEDYDSLKKDVETEFEYLVEKLLREEQAIDSQGSFHPTFTYNNDRGEVADYVMSLVNEHKTNMVVMGMSGAGSFSRFYLGSNSKEMIEKADFPLLLIPLNVDFKEIKKISFATDLSSQDIEIIASLVYFARPFNAEILITHVTQENDINPEEQKKIDDFLSNVTCKVNYPRIYYRSIQSSGINEGLNWLTENGHIDIMAMVHRHESFFTRLLTSSHTQQLAKSIHVPLLVFPENFNRVII